MKPNSILAALLATASTAAAHGYVQKIEVAGEEYPGYHPDIGESSGGLIAWSTEATDQGFVQDLHSPDIICHRGAVPGDISAEVPAGGTVTVTWSSWPQEHKGPVLDYLANCNGDCTNVDKTTLKFFKIDEGGYDGTQWATDQLLQQGKSWDITVPSDLKAGNYVLRHEIIALHSTTNGPQPYPQCVNLKVTGGGSSEPAGVPGTELYQGDEPGLNFNIWDTKAVPSYEIPGPKLFAAGDDSTAPTSSSTSSSSSPSSTSTTTLVSTPSTAISTSTTTTTPVTSSSKPLFTPTSTLLPTATGLSTGITPSSSPSHLVAPSSTPARCAASTVFYTVTMTTTTATTQYKTETRTNFRTDTVTETSTPEDCGFGQSTVTLSANC
ncbi:hypothetical protein ASPVEDRAFT_590794 [Aspergillus versicolor CBS 583.65]|uniref:Auxiliary Activity family 9 catalytic domain-containing protein n=1 Tax=Aspergillus versicolor CBS 583.65 TaxID=1036611 RepID=A0A1L9PH26_ASPVE|nr:uncharacterized protein ASPVEDRAFT_590794 [Aspergillus versicolor CBS 583.65]OJJ00820.1 hypothetical protein ASPVEDRAFT_590794 [Aspergillus versicolor CBS 583.65]